MKVDVRFNYAYFIAGVLAAEGLIQADEFEEFDDKFRVVFQSLIECLSALNLVAPDDDFPPLVLLKTYRD